MTFICSISKGKNPKTPKDFRSIILCNVIMKAVTKTIRNKIKPILLDIVGEEQSDFIKCHLISENGLIMMECFHWMKIRQKVKENNGLETRNV